MEMGVVLTGWRVVGPAAAASRWTNGGQYSQQLGAGFGTFQTHPKKYLLYAE